MNESEHEYYMSMALKQALQAEAEGEVPVGVVIVSNSKIIGKAHNQVELLKDPTAHAEMIAITQAASAINDWRLNDAVMYVTKEPCAMCSGAIVLARISKVVWALDDPIRGGGRSCFNILQNPALNHSTEIVTDVLQEESQMLIQNFFKERRK